MITATLAKNTFPQSEEQLRQSVIKKLNAAIEELATIARQTCPVGIERTGEPHMRDTIVVETFQGGKLKRLRILSPHALFVIRGHHAPDGTWIAPNLFLDRAVEQMKRSLPRDLRRLL